MTISPSSPPVPRTDVMVTGLGWISAVNSGCGTDKQRPRWDEGTPTIPTSILNSLKGGSRFGRLDLFSQIGVATVGLALQDAGYFQANRLAAAETDRQLRDNATSIALISSTTSSCNLTDREFYKTVQNDPGLASPGLFVYTLATSFLGEAALRFSLTGASMAVIEPQPHAGAALALACEELISGDDEVVVTGFCNLFEQNSAAPRFSGALFLVLEKELKKTTRVHAVLSYDPETKLFFVKDQPCPDIFSLSELICG